MPRSTKEIREQADELARRFEQFQPDPADTPAAEALAAVHRAALARAQAETAVARAVDEAKSHGVSWDALGRRLGTTGEAARQRYGQKTHKA